MNAHKKTIMALGMTLALLPQIATALDTDGTAITGALKTIYTNNFMPDKILTDTDLTTWNNIINTSFSNYITKNNTLAGIKDTLLINSRDKLLDLNTRMMSGIKMGRATVNERSASAIPKLQQLVQGLEKLKSDIVTVETPLKKESYYYSNKQNAKEVLLFVLEYMRGATETAIAQIKRNIPAGY